MTKLRQIAANLNSFDIMRELDIILNNLNKTIIGLNQQQLEIGKDANNSTLAAYAEPYYALFKKNEMGSKAPLGIPNLKLTGAFFDGFTIITDSKKIVITSKDLKTLQLEGQYGDIFGLTPEHLDELAIRYILPGLQKSLKLIFKV